MHLGVVAQHTLVGARVNISFPVVRHLHEVQEDCSAASAACVPAMRPNVAPAIIPEPDA